MTEHIVLAILSKSNDLNVKPQKELDEANEIVTNLTNFFYGKIELNVNDISYLNEKLTVYTIGIPVSIPLSSGTVISRAMEYENNPEDNNEYMYDNVSRLSYHPNPTDTSPTIGRLNKQGEALFYGFLNADANSIGVLLSECHVEKNQIFNILQCRTEIKTFSEQVDTSLHLIPIGIMDYFRRGVQTPFQLHNTFKEIYDLIKQNTHPTAMMALHLTDAFMTSLLKKDIDSTLYEEKYASYKERLYTITSQIASKILKATVVDGIIYPSVKFESQPNVAIRPSSVDKKIRYATVTAIEILEKYGFGMFKTKILNQGNVNANEIEC